MNKNLLIAIVLSLVGAVLIVGAGVVGYHVFPPVTDGVGNQTRGWGAVLGIVIVVATVAAVVIINTVLNDRDKSIKERNAR